MCFLVLFGTSTRCVAFADTSPRHQFLDCGLGDLEILRMVSSRIVHLLYGYRGTAVVIRSNFNERYNEGYFENLYISFVFEHIWGSVAGARNL